MPSALFVSEMRVAASSVLSHTIAFAPQNHIYLSPQNDLRYLFDMLHEGHVKPPIADCIPLAKVAETQKLLEAKRVQGFFVCKPWLK